MSDPIDRQAAIDEVCKMMYECFGADEEELDAIEVTLHELPSAGPKRKKGKWVAIGNTGLAACKCEFFTDRYRAYNFCPNCGAEMGGSKDE